MALLWVQPKIRDSIEIGGRLPGSCRGPGRGGDPCSLGEFSGQNGAKYGQSSGAAALQIGCSFPFPKSPVRTLSDLTFCWAMAPAIDRTKQPHFSWRLSLKVPNAKHSTHRSLHDAVGCHSCHHKWAVERPLGRVAACFLFLPWLAGKTRYRLRRRPVIGDR